MTPTLFDVPVQMDTPPGEPARTAVARVSDPQTSHDAARTVREPALLNAAIVSYVRIYGPVTRFQVADALSETRRWRHDTVRTRVSALAGKGGPLSEADNCGVSPAGRACKRYVVGGTVRPAARYL